MGTVKVTNIEPIADNGTVTLGGSGDTITLGSGATVTGTGLVGITMVDQWRLTAATNTGTNADVTTNWERNDNTGYGGIGTGLTESSGIFSFPSTGIYLILFTAQFLVPSNDQNIDLFLKATTDNSTYNNVSVARSGNKGTAQTFQGSPNQFLFDVTDTSNCKFKFTTSSFSSGAYLGGSSSYQSTGFTVIRLGDT